VLFFGYETVQYRYLCSCTDIGFQEEACRVAQEKLSSNPLLVRIHSLEREKAQLETMLKKENLARVDLKDWMQKTQEKIPKLQKNSQKRWRRW